jgi:hypothetical protein
MILQSSIADFVAKDSVRAIKNHSRSMLDSRKYSSMVDIFFLSQHLSVEIQVIYPSHNNSYTKRELFSGTIKPEGTAVRRIVISWTSTDESSIELLGQGKWRPNHFVPCICKEKKDEVSIAVFYRLARGRVEQICFVKFKNYCCHYKSVSFCRGCITC